MAAEQQRIYHLLDPAPPELLEPRRFIREGAVSLIEKGKPQKRHLFLFHDSLLLTTPKKDKFKLNLFINFNNKAVDLEDAEDNRFMLIGKKSSKKFIFEALDKESWFADIQQAYNLELDGIPAGVPVIDGKFDPYGMLTDDQKAVFDSVKQLLNERDPPLDEREVKWLDDACICRYLRARQYDVKKAYQMLSNSLDWRKEFKPHEITPEQIFPEAESGKVYVSKGRDALGRPVVYMRPSKDTNAAPETKINFVVWILENASNIMKTTETGIEKMTWVVDFSSSNFGAPTTDNVKVAKGTLQIVQDHYPERLGNAFLLNPPFVFNAMYKLLYPFIDPVTKQKIQFLKKDEFKKLLLYIRKEELEKEYGGESEWVYDANEWLAEQQAILNETSTSTE